jgi:DNA polymerase-3 subunit epsilon
VRQKLYEYLLARPYGASSRELLDLVFTAPGADPELGPRLLHGLLADDRRFVYRENEARWCALVHETLARPLSTTTFVIVDLETTGLVQGPAAILEIGAARLREGRVVEEYQQLVNPGVPVPRFITHLTGIDDTMVAMQPHIAAVWPQFRAFVGDAVLVAHNAQFDLTFLDAAARTFDGVPLPNPHLCTLKLARRLLPGVRRRGLDALAAHFAIPQPDRHRALGDVRITVEILFHLMERMSARGIVRLDEAIDLQHRARDGRRFESFLPRHVVEQLPPRPGTYSLLDADGRLLYIGKAKSLRERVASYLSNSINHSNKTLDLIRHAHDVRVRVAGSELEAALDEADAIRRHQPPYNRLGKHLPRIAFVKLALASPYPRLLVTSRMSLGRARYLGPYRSRAEAQRVVALLARLFRLRTCAPRLRPDPASTPCLQGQIGACSAPCAARADATAYAAQVAACLALLDGDSAAAERELVSRRDQLATELRFEAAGKVQRDLQLLERLVRRQRLLGWVVTQRNFLIMHPSAEKSSVLLYVVLAGRLVLRSRLLDVSEITKVAAQVSRMAACDRSRPLGREDVEGTTILAAWLRDRGETDGCVFPLQTTDVPATQVAEWRAACETLMRPAAGGDQAAPCPEGNGHQHEQPTATGVTAAVDGAATAP